MFLGQKTGTTSTSSWLYASEVVPEGNYLSCFRFLASAPEEEKSDPLNHSNC